MTSWFRSWHGAPTDNKWLVIAMKAKVAPGIVSAVAWALLDHASQADDRGSVADFDTETYAVFSGFDESQVQAVIAAMHEKGVIDSGGRLSSWDKRQPKREDDLSTERVRKHREKKGASNESNDTDDNGTQCNALKRTETQETHTETETETEQNRTEENRKERINDAQADGRTEPVAVEAIPLTSEEDQKMTAAIAAKLRDVGVCLSPYMIDMYVSAAQDHGIHATLAGITAAAEQGKQQKTSYVLACIRNKAAGDERKAQPGAPVVSGRLSNAEKTQAAFARIAARMEQGQGVTQ